MRTPALVLFAILLAGASAACGGDTSARSAETSILPSPSNLVPVTPTPGRSPSSAAIPSPTEAATTTPAEPGCAAGEALADGTWSGPITLQVRAGDGGSGYPDAPGRGKLRLTVSDSTVTDGSWKLTWTSQGKVETGSAAATVNLTGTVTGTVHGSAARPRLKEAWSITGVANLTRPQRLSMPFTERGVDQQPLRLAPQSCDQATGTFLLNVPSKDAAVTFTGAATWVGVRT